MRTEPRRTKVYSSNSGVCPGSFQPPGLSIRAMLTAALPVFRRPTYSAIRLGGLPAASSIVGRSIKPIASGGAMRLRGLTPQRLADARQVVPTVTQRVVFDDELRSEEHTSELQSR